jgi:GNAT superfamily N-acetyltransferase
LDDLYVDEDVRGRGVGTALLRAVARVSVRHGCPRLEWVTGASNAKAIGFYERMGADVKHALRVCRLSESAIAGLADGRT